MLLAIMVTYESKDSFRGIKMYYKKIHHENTIYKHNKKSFSLAPYINFNLKCGIYIYIYVQSKWTCFQKQYDTNTAAEYLAKLLFVRSLHKHTWIK